MRFPTRLFRLAAILLLLSHVAATQTVRVFFGNLHSHTSYSDGSGLPAEAYRHAREGGLDFLVISEHNHRQAESGASPDRLDGILIAKDPTLYTGPQEAALIPASGALTQEGAFLALYAQEFSSISKGNHVNVFDVPDVIDVPNGAFDQLLAWISSHLDSSGQTAVLQFNHPALLNDASLEYGADDFGSRAEWIRRMDQHVRLIEVLNGPAMTKVAGNRAAEFMEDDYLRFLNLGFHVAPTADQDNHYRTWGTATDARTAIITDELTKSKFFEALHARHVYATEDRNLRMIFRVNGHLCGDRITDVPPANSELKIEFSIKDDDEPDAEYQIQVFSGDGPGKGPARVIETVTVRGDTETGKIEDVRYNGQTQYLFFKVTQSSEHEGPDRAWTAPVWLEPAGSPVVTDDGSSEASLVASRNSKIYHLSADCSSAKAIKPENRITGREAKKGRTQHPGCPL
ncbi:MAG: CehA/McbA family metallohydrolase [Acidobacteria bacterium]|nr:CehA/McbA family metallohydrolase [Acidobacteriota bacterium]